MAGRKTALGTKVASLKLRNSKHHKTYIVVFWTKAEDNSKKATSGYSETKWIEMNYLNYTMPRKGAGEEGTKSILVWLANYPRLSHKTSCSPTTGKNDRMRSKAEKGNKSLSSFLPQCNEPRFKRVGHRRRKRWQFGMGTRTLCPPISPSLIQAWYQVCNTVHIVIRHQVLCGRAVAGHISLCLLQAWNPCQGQNRIKATVFAKQDVCLQSVTHHEHAGGIHSKTIHNALKHVSVGLPNYHCLAPRCRFNRSSETPCP